MSIEELELSQYDLVNWTSYSQLEVPQRANSKYNRSMVSLQFTFQRQKGMVVKVLIQKRSYTWSRLIKTKYLQDLPQKIV